MVVYCECLVLKEKKNFIDVLQIFYLLIKSKKKNIKIKYDDN